MFADRIWECLHWDFEPIVEIDEEYGTVAGILDRDLRAKGRRPQHDVPNPPPDGPHH